MHFKTAKRSDFPREFIPAAGVQGSVSSGLSVPWVEVRRCGHLLCLARAFPIDLLRRFQAHFVDFRRFHPKHSRKRMASQLIQSQLPCGKNMHGRASLPPRGNMCRALLRLHAMFVRICPWQPSSSGEATLTLKRPRGAASGINVSNIITY